MADPWKIGAMAWCLTVLSWLFAPVIGFMVNKLFAYLCVDVERKLNELEINTIPTLKLTMMGVQEQMMRIAAKGKGRESDLKTLDKMNKVLKSSLYDAEDMLDLVAYHQIEKKVSGDTSIWEKHLRDAARAFLAGCKGRPWFRGCADIARDAGTRCSEGWNQLLCRLGLERQSSTYDPETPGNRPKETSSAVQAPRSRSWFLPIYNSCRSIFSWLTDVIVVLRSYRDWSYEVAGIKINKKDNGIGLDSFQLTVHRKSLRKTMEQIDSVITDFKKSPLLTEQSTSNNLYASVNDIDKKSSSNNLLSVEDKHKESTSDQKEIDDMHRSIRQPIFGRQEDQEHISRLLREEPSSSSNSTSYSVIGIHGIKGSGKTTLARCVCDHEKIVDEKHFDTTIFIPLYKTFRLQDIFCDMLMEITLSDWQKKSIEQDGQSRCKDLESLESLISELKDKLKGRNVQSLCKELKEKLKGRRFLLVLDDLWVNDENQKERDILLGTLDAGKSGSGILVTAQTKDAAAALGAQKQISIPELRMEEYLSLFMHHALQGTCDGDGEYRAVGIRIVEKLRKSPIAAVAVAKRLQKNKSIGFWEMTANLDVLNETMGALWWSYQQLGSDVRRCFEYCGIFPRGYELERDAVIDMWIAQGFVKTSNATEELEDVGQRYFEELLTFSFLQACSSPTFTGYFTIHDLLHELAERVAGGDLFRIGPNGSSQQLIPPEGTSAAKIPPEVRHLFIETYGIEATSAKKIPELENLRTLIIEEKYRPDEEVCIRGGNIERHRLAMEKLFKVMFRKMRKLRVLMVRVIKRQHNLVLSVPGSIGQMKHLRLLQYRYTGHIMLSQKANIRPPSLKIIFPSTFCKLYHMQILKFTLPDTKVSLPKDTANKLIHLRRIRGALRMTNVGRLASLQSMPWFFVRKIPGCELKQLKHLNNLRGRLDLHGLRNVGSKDEALEANLAGKKRLTELGLDFTRSNPDVAAEVLEGFLPPKDLKKLILWRFIGSRYASWMFSPQNPDAPRNLDTLVLVDCIKLVSIPEGTQLFARLRSLRILQCTWDALPEHMEHLKSLEKLTISCCDKIEILPTLPQSLRDIRIIGENMLWTSFQDETHVNRQRIEHVPYKNFQPGITDYGIALGS